jgi:hypothetical protein
MFSPIGFLQQIYTDIIPAYASNRVNGNDGTHLITKNHAELPFLKNINTVRK